MLEKDKKLTSVFVKQSYDEMTVVNV